MRLPRNVTFTLIASLIVLNLIERYPSTPHELGYDAFIFHGMTLSLTVSGSAKWVLTPLSYLGLYPLSQPSGSIFTLASLSLVSDVSIEGAVLAFDWVSLVLGTLGAFMLSMEIRRDEVLGLLIAAFFSLSPRYVTGLLWEIPTRTFFTTLIPIFLFFLLRWYHDRDVRWLGFVAVALLIMVSFHRLSVLMSVVLIAFVLTAILLVVMKTLRIQYASRLLSPRARRVQGILAIAAFFGVTAALLFGAGVLPGYSEGQIGTGTGLAAEATNLGVSIARSSGFLVALVPIGVVAMYQMRAKDFKEPFLLVVLLLLVPTLSLRQYTGYYIIPMTAVFTGIAIWWILTRLRRRASRMALIAFAIAVTVASSTIVVTYDLQFSPYLDSRSYVTGLYVGQRTEGTLVSNDGVLASEVFLVSGSPCLPVGGATTAFQSPELLIYGFVNRSSLEITPIPIAKLTLESDSIFDLQGVQAELDWAVLLNTPMGSVPAKIWNTYHPRYLLEDLSLGEKYAAYGNRYDSPFIGSVHAESYALMTLDNQTLWYLGGPG